MRSQVYRNLDSPFRIIGFSPLELCALSVALVGGGELARALLLNRVWPFVLALIVGGSLLAFRRSFGDLFARRLIRFLELPGSLRPKLFEIGRLD